MRISQSEISAFIQVLSSYLSPGSGSLFLYGSRVDDALKGGDIDLVLVISSIDQANHLKMLRSSILNQFKMKLGDRRIDFSILCEQEVSQDLFFSQVIPAAVLLKKW